MKTKCLAAFILSAAFCSYGQGTTFLYDQQSSTNEEGNYGYGNGPSYQEMVPNTGQSFTPGLAGVDFIKLEINDSSPSSTVGSTWFLNLRSDSITGPILGTTASVGLPGGFTGAANFLFPSTVATTPGTTYYFDINSPDGGPWHLVTGRFNYPGGNAWGRNQSLDVTDYWFREGLVVPEPSSAALLLLGGAAFLCFRRSSRK